MSRKPREPSTIVAFLPIAATLTLLMFHIFVNGGGPHIPLILGVFITTVFGLVHGYSWTEMQAAMVENIAISVPVLGIFFAVGMTISTWILCGTVPFLTNLGLTILTPTAFLPLACIVCSIVSVFTGTSWGTVGTIGLALLGIGEGMGVPAHLTAGAVVSGAWFGDKMSPANKMFFCAAILAAITSSLPSRTTFMSIACPTRNNPIMFLTSLVRRTLRPPTSVMTSPVCKPARDAGESCSTWVITTPLVVSS